MVFQSKLGIKHLQVKKFFLSYIFQILGNHLRKLLSNVQIINQVSNIIPNVTDDIALELEILLCLGKIQNLTISKFLSEHDIDLLKHHIEELEKLLFSLKKPRITPKVQLLLRHTLPFVEKYKLWGRSSEQSIEHLHAVVNKNFRRFCAIKNTKKLLLQILELNVLRNFVFDS